MNTSTPSVPLPALATAKELATELGLPLPSVYRLVRGGQIPVVKLGRSYRFSRDEVRAWLAKGGTEARE